VEHDPEVSVGVSMNELQQRESILTRESIKRSDTKDCWIFSESKEEEEADPLKNERSVEGSNLQYLKSAMNFCPVYHDVRNLYIKYCIIYLILICYYAVNAERTFCVCGIAFECMRNCL
jgi:hypothetical protein